MEGPKLLAATMSVPVARGPGGKRWQYHSRSDRHSKAACWTILFDLMRECDIFRAHVAAGKVSFAVNYEMVGKIVKTLDLVVCRDPGTRERKQGRSFEEYGSEIGIVMTKGQRALLSELPEFHEELPEDIAEVMIALEAKACMTDHSGAIPRLFAEILATGYLARQAARDCITASHTIVNGAETFVSPGAKMEVKPNGATGIAAVVRMLHDALPTAAEAPNLGFDAVGVTVLKCRNDGSTVELVDGAPAPKRQNHHHYERMIRNMCAAYRARFGSV
jgi:hypothetical protein